MGLRRFSHRYTWLIGQLLVLLVSFWYIQHIYFSNILPDKIAKNTFKKTQCFLLSKKLSVKGHLVHRYRSDFFVSYNARGMQYNHWVSGNGLDDTYVKDQSDEEDILSQFDVGGSYPCWFNPRAPERLILVWRHNWYSTLSSLIVPALAFLIALVCVLRNVWKWVRR